MKKNIVRRFLSISCALMMIVSLSIPALAVGDQSNNATLPNGKTVYLEDGTRVTIAIVPATSTLDLNIESGWARPNASFTLSCLPANGNYARWDTTNIGDTSMDVTYSFTIPGEAPIVMSETVTSGNRMFAYAETKSGNGLNMNVSISISARGTAANYSFAGEQFWWL